MKIFLHTALLLLAVFALGADEATSKNNSESSDNAASLQPKMLRIAGNIDGSGRIVFTRHSVIYEHKHWDPPTDVTFDGEPWDLARTPESWDSLGGTLDLTKAWIVKRSGRDVIASNTRRMGLISIFVTRQTGPTFTKLRLRFRDASPPSLLRRVSPGERRAG